MSNKSRQEQKNTRVSILGHCSKVQRMSNKSRQEQKNTRVSILGHCSKVQRMSNKSRQEQKNTRVSILGHCSKVQRKGGGVGGSKRVFRLHDPVGETHQNGLFSVYDPLEGEV